MEALETLKEDVRVGRIGPERLVEICGALQRQLAATQQLLETAQQRVAELEMQPGTATTAKDPKRQTVTSHFGVCARTIQNWMSTAFSEMRNALGVSHE